VAESAKLSLTFILDIHFTITNNSFHTKIYDKRNDFDFGIVNYSHLDGDVPHATSYGVYISQLIRFTRVIITKLSNFLLKEVMTLLFEDIPHASTLLQLNATLFSFDYI
jgi:hypothetical protein